VARSFERTNNKTKPMIVTIEQRLQDPAQFLILPADEAAFLAFPTMMGILGRQVLLGVAAGLILWSLWRRLKGEGGLEGFAAALYWHLPTRLSGFSPFPDSSVSVWEA
jgi:conjugal transfer pilus assembly protein TraL